jgi:flagellar hook protein FlgE
MANNASIIQCEAHIYIPTAPVLGGTPAAATSPIPTIGAEILDIAIDFGGAGILGEGDRGGCYSDAAGSYQLVNGVNTYIPNQTASISGQDGYAEGTLQDFSFDAAGKIQGMFSNGEIIVLGQVAMARMDNNEGLVSVGTTTTPLLPTADPCMSGSPDGRYGWHRGWRVGRSNVDLTTELTNMIIAQRGFEVNAQTVRVGNEVLQTTVNLGR